MYFNSNAVLSFGRSVNFDDTLFGKSNAYLSNVFTY